MKPLDKNETGELIAAIHSLGKDKVRELALLMWQHIHELDAANSPEIPDGWIACGERLPKVGDVVLISIDGFISVGESVRSWGGYRYFTSVATGRELTATHWMPLPAPPAAPTELLEG